MIDALVRDALAVLTQLNGPEAAEQPEGPAANAIGLLALIAGQDVELTEPDSEDPDHTPRWQIARRVAPDR